MNAALHSFDPMHSNSEACFKGQGANSSALHQGAEVAAVHGAQVHWLVDLTSRYRKRRVLCAECSAAARAGAAAS